MDRKDIDYKFLKNLATRKIGPESKERIGINRVCALSPNNDPFYVTDVEVKLAEWFLEIWDRFGEIGEYYLRGIHYKMIVQEEPIMIPNERAPGKKSVYENTDACWARLSKASELARYLGLIERDAVGDRRNPDPIIYDERIMPYFEIEGGHYDIGSEFSFPKLPKLPRIMLIDFEPDQKYHLEIWCEKTSMNHVLLPLCECYNVDYITGMGEMSVLAPVMALERIERLSKPARIFYISDFDPTGHGIPVSVSRKLEFFVEEGIDIRLYPIALTEDQVKKYRLPRTPIKPRERRKKNWEERFGKDAVELDALEALYPGSLKELTENWILKYYDTTLSEKTSDEQARIYMELREAEEDAFSEYAETFEEIQKEHSELKKAFVKRFDALQKKYKELNNAFYDELEGCVPGEEDHPRPEGEDREDPDGALYSTERDYFEQLRAYKEYLKLDASGLNNLENEVEEEEEEK